MSNESSKLFLQMLKTLLGETDPRFQDKPGGMTPKQLSKAIAEAFDEKVHKEIGTVCNGKINHALMASFITILAETIANSAGDEESVCGTSILVGDMIHNAAHSYYLERMGEDTKAPTHHFPPTKN